MFRNLMLVAALTMGVTACATAMTMPAKTGETALGTVMVDGKGMTLYTFAKDTMPGKSVCNGGCAKNWPPLMVPPGATAEGDWTIVSRDDGTKQWAYKGKPLYTWIKDQQPGDTTGDGFLNGAWHVAKP